MNKIVTLLGASAFSLGVLSSGAQAKLVHYEINGKRYSYSTNNRAQAAEARKRIEAAKAAETAKAKAEAEKAKYPLTAVFASQTQREATEAQARLQQLLSGKDDTAEPASIQERRTAKDSSRDDWRGKIRTASIKEASALDDNQQSPGLAQGMARLANSTLAKSTLAKTTLAPVPDAAETPDARNQAKKVRSVSFDVESGIKTTIMIDGSIEEEPFDSSVVQHLAPEQGSTNSLTAFVNQLRKASPEEATGSITPRQAEPANLRLPH